MHRLGLAPGEERQTDECRPMNWASAMALRTAKPVPGYRICFPSPERALRLRDDAIADAGFQPAEWVESFHGCLVPEGSKNVHFFFVGEIPARRIEILRHLLGAARSDNGASQSGMREYPSGG